MLLELKRYASSADSTGGLLFIDGKFCCFVCEDEYRDVKIAGETRIPAGTFTIKLRNAGGMTKKYAARYSFHKGMLHLQDVPGFEYVYIHVGNTDDDSLGCLLVGMSAHRAAGENTVGGSSNAYKMIYPRIAKALLDGESVSIIIADIK